MDTEPFWEAVPVIVNDKLMWMLVKYHTTGGTKYRDRHGHFALLDDVQSAINHLESEPVRIPAKGKT